MSELQDDILSPPDFQPFFTALKLPRVIASIDFHLPPYTLSPENIARTPYDLPGVCDADWERAVLHLAKGYIAQWLRSGVAPLREKFQHGPGDELEAMAICAIEMARIMAAGDSVVRNAALETFLLSLGADKPKPRFSSEQINFSPIGVESPCAEISLIVTNLGRGFLFGEIISQVSWLEVKTPRLGCFKGESFFIVLHPHLENIPAGQYDQVDALVIKTPSGEQQISAKIQILPAILQLDADKLDFGAVGLGEDAAVKVRVRNRGAGFLAGTIESQLPGVHALPKFWRVGAGEETMLEIEVDTFEVTGLDVRRERAVVIESNGGRAELSLAIRVLPPHAKVEPARLDLRAVDIAQVERNQMPEAEIKITNDGKGLLIGKLVPDEDWVTVEPTEFRCEPGTSQQFQLSVTNLKVGKYVQAVRLRSNAGEILLPVWLDVVFSLKPAVLRIPIGRFLRGSLSHEQIEASGCVDPFSELSHDLGHRRIVIDAAEQPQAEILLSEYWIGKYPVTNAEYAVFVQATGRRAPEHWNGNEPPEGTAYHPVTNVTWFQARAYCTWLSEITGKPYDLPTEAQWEKAARGMDGRIYPWGNNWDRHLCNTVESLRRSPNEVGMYSPNGDSPYGCCDISGNVWEWNLDWFNRDYYSHSNVDRDPLGPAHGMVKVIRGGSYRADAMQALCANRSYANPNNASPEVGFRVAMKSEA